MRTSEYSFWRKFCLGGLMIGILWACEAPRGSISLMAVDPLEKVLREVADFSEVKAKAEVARGEHASIQFALRPTRELTELEVTLSELQDPEGNSLTEGKVGFPAYVKVGRSTPRPSRDRIPSPSGFYPDPILEEAPVKISAHTSQSIWLSIEIPEQAIPGIYTGEMMVKGKLAGKPFTESREIEVEVFSPVVSQTRLWVTNWFSMAPKRLALLNGGKPVSPYSETYWKLARVFARQMKAYRQNVVLLSPLRLATYTEDKGTYRIDFSRFDKMVEIFMEEGAIGRIEGGHIGGRQGNWTSPFVVYVPRPEADTTIFEKHPIGQEPAKSFYSQFIPALTQHLAEKGWDSLYLQHLADEPIAENIDSYVEMATFVKALAPDLKIIEACHTRDLQDAIDVWVPQLNFMHEDYEFYQKRQAEGDEIWFYTCLAPQEEYANRFIELPLLKTRVIHWINFRYNIPGYLHWGLNAWRGDPYEETTGIIKESGNVLPGGDAWIVYPAEGKLLSSLRQEAMRDGIVDHELLMRYAEIAPKEAQELARQVVYLFDRYDMNLPAFREKRRTILERLSEWEAKALEHSH